MTKDDGFIWDDSEEVKEEKSVEKPVEELINFEELKKKPKKKKKAKQKWKKRLVFIIFILILVLLLFMPILNVSEIKISQTYFVTQKEIENSIGITKGESYSFWQLKNDSISDDISELVSDIKVSYDFKTATLYIDVEEIKPLAIDQDGTFYYSANGEILTTNQFYYSVPKLIGFNEEMTKQLVAALNTLDYKIIKEIVGIEYVEDEILPDLVMMQMMDGNIVYITISEIENKMPYYLQISQIIDQEASKKPGIIHLERGNYYEPI